MKKYRLISIVLAMLMACSAGPTESGNIPNNQAVDALVVKGTRLATANSENIVLRGVSFGWHNWWPRFYNAKAVKWLKDDWGVNVVRAAMGVEPDGAYLDNPAWAIEKITAVVDAAIEEDLYVIIDWHSHHIRLPEAREFFQQMAEKYGEYPNVIYEIYNEPEADTWPEVKAYSVEVIEAIREIDPDNLILVGSPHWDQDVHLAADDPIAGFENLMYTLHFYAATHKKELRDRADYALQNGLPLFVSECAGMRADGNGPIDDKSWKAWYTWMEKNKISWLTWSISDKDETCSMLHPSASSEGGWSEDEVKEWGSMTKSFLGLH